MLPNVLEKFPNVVLTLLPKFVAKPAIFVSGPPIGFGVGLRSEYAALPDCPPPVDLELVVLLIGSLIISFTLPVIYRIF